MRRRGGWILAILLVAFVVLPIAEVMVLIRTGQAIGAWPTLGLLILSSALGAWLAQREGARAWRALTQSFQSGRLPTGELADAALVLAGSIFLIFPGFITDIVGLLFLLPFTRPLGRKLIAWLVARWATKSGIDLTQIKRDAQLATDQSTIIPGETVPDSPQANPEVIRGEIEN